MPQQRVRNASKNNMKRILKKLLALAAALSLTGVCNFTPAGAAGREYNVVYFGGSATCGTDKYDTWMEQVSDRLEKETGARINSFYEGVPNTGSEVGQYRAYEKINSRNPDLVFIDFAADDIDIATTEFVENIILTVGAADNPTGIVFVNSARFDSSSTGMLVSGGIEIERLAEHYSLDAVDMLTVMEMRDDIPSLFENDGISLSQEGHNLFAEEISRAVLYGSCAKKPDMTREPYNTGAKAVKAAVNTLKNSTYGAKTIKFCGKSFIAAHTRDSEGAYKIVIDDKYTAEIKISSSPSCIGWSVINLADSYHTAVITPSDGSRVNLFEYYTDINAVQNPFINESFENGHTKAKAVNGATVSIVSEGARAGEKALRVVSSQTTGTALMFPMNFVKGTYKLSCYVKTVGFVPKEEFSTFTPVVYSKTAAGGNGYNMYTLSDVKYLQDEWVYIETEITNDGQCYYNGSRVDAISENSQIQLRIGDKNGNLANTNNGKAVTYEIDNFVLEPVAPENCEKINVTAEQNAGTLTCRAVSDAENIKLYSYKLLKSTDGFKWDIADTAVTGEEYVCFDVPDTALYRAEVSAVDSEDNICAEGESGIDAAAGFSFDRSRMYNITLSADYEKLSAKYSICGLEDKEVCVIYAQYGNNEFLQSCETENMRISNKTVSFTKDIDANAKSLKIMVFDVSERMKPVAECKTERKGE